MDRGDPTDEAPPTSQSAKENNGADSEEVKPFVGEAVKEKDGMALPWTQEVSPRLTRFAGVFLTVLVMSVVAVSVPRASSRQGTLGDGAVMEQSPIDEHIPLKIYPIWNHTFPCYPHTKHNKFKKGLLYVKVPKTASSTLAGVGLRIAHRKGSQLLPHDKGGDEGVCNVRTSHGDVINEFHYDKRDRLRSFLWTFVRDPTRRTVSQYFFSQVSRRGEEPTDENFIKWARAGSKSSGTFQMDYIRLRNYDNYDSAVRGILDDYDFIGVTERLDESLAVLQIILDLDVGDALYMSAKAKQGAYVYLRGKRGSRCIFEGKSFVSPGMEEYFVSDEWRDHIAGDSLLYRAANHSLDKTIDRIGRERVALRLQEFRDALKVATDRCKKKAVFPCSEDGVLQEEKKNCYAMDEGCGYPCLDDVAKDLGIG